MTAPDGAVVPCVVAVRSRFDGRWCEGYVLEELVPAPVGFRAVVRHADGTPVGELFGLDEVRAMSIAAAVELLHIDLRDALPESPSGP